MLCATVAGLQLLEFALGLTAVFHNCGRNCGKRQNFRLKTGDFGFMLFFIPITVTVPAGPCKAIGAKAFQRIRII